MNVLRVALVSGSPLVRAGLRAGLVDAGGFEVVLDAASLGDARRAGFGAAEVALAEFGADADAAPEIGEWRADAGAAPPLLALLPARAAGAAAWWRHGVSVLPADAPMAQIAAAARAAAAGLVACDAAMLAWPGSAAGAAEAELHEPLTRREREVLAQMTAGLGNREIAEALHISPHTAKFHVAQIIAKLDASSRAHAVAKGLRAGLLAA